VLLVLGISGIERGRGGREGMEGWGKSCGR
jgi:hypothetical protein